MAATSINCLAVVLQELGWSYTRLIAELRREAAVDRIVLPKPEVSSRFGAAPIGGHGRWRVGRPSGSSSRRGAAAGRTRSWRLPAPARTRPRLGGVRCTSAACRTGWPTRGCAPPANGGWPGWALAARGWRSGRPCPVRPAPAGRAGVVNGVQMHHWPLGQHPDHGDGVQRRRQQPVVAAVGRGRHCPQRDAARLGEDRPFSPCLRRSTGLGPALSPQGALVMHPSTARCSSWRPCMRS
jgi:hypothetical protein